MQIGLGHPSRVGHEGVETKIDQESAMTRLSICGRGLDRNL